MPVINVEPRAGAHIAEGVAPELMHVYCVAPGPAQFGITIFNPPPPYTMRQLTAGHMLTFQVGGFQAWVINNGPSRIQLLIPDRAAFDGVGPDEVEGVSALEAES